MKHDLTRQIADVMAMNGRLVRALEWAINIVDGSNTPANKESALARAREILTQGKLGLSEPETVAEAEARLAELDAKAGGAG